MSKYIKRLVKFFSPSENYRDFGEVIYEDANLVVIKREGNGELNFVSFSGIGGNIEGVELQTTEFNYARKFGSALFVIDKTRSWGNHLPMQELLKIITATFGSREMVFIGSSMGGFLAILASKFIRPKMVIAYSPQWSVHPKIVPFEDRWGEYISNIRHFEYKSLEGFIRQEQPIKIIYGKCRSDEMHIELFKGYKNIEFIQIDTNEHNVAGYMKKLGMLKPQIDMVVEELK